MKINPQQSRASQLGNMEGNRLEGTHPTFSGQLELLHQRMLKGDPAAFDAIAQMLLVPLMKRVSNRFPQADSQAVADAVTDALFY
jgi:hypothetical protein